MKRMKKTTKMVMKMMMKMILQKMMTIQKKLEEERSIVNFTDEIEFSPNDKNFNISRHSGVISLVLG